ncbi:MAG: SIMPL domain-containing protein [Selenomonadaceae bacterium]|nr:SIMPL domain-containing protein [Selenomonadaceae bacterium]
MQLLRKLALALAFSAFIMPQPVSHAATAESAISILSVDGIGRTTATPDRASVNIGVTTSAADASNAQRENDSRIQNIVDGLKELGIAAGDIRTDHYSFRPDYTFRESRGSEITGYTVDNSVIVKVKNVDLVGRVIDTALQRGANQINSLEFGISDTKSLRKQALNAAIQDAREKADILASGLGHRIIGIHHVTENTGSFTSRQFDSMMLAAASKNAAVPIESGTVSLDANVHIDFILDK